MCAQKVHMHTNRRAHTLTHTYTYTHTHTHTQADTHTQTHAHMLIYTQAEALDPDRLAKALTSLETVPLLSKVSGSLD